MSDETIRGSCACGAIEVELEPPTLFCGHCHCRDCRSVHGAAFVTWTAVPAERFRIVTGSNDLVAYASSGPVTRSFCGSCGTHVMYVSTETLDRVYIPRAVLPSLDREPELHVNVREAVPWCVLAEDGLPRYDGFD